jgi:putative drug exporter of the RND superfamily
VRGEVIAVASVVFAGTSAALAGQETVEVTDAGIAGAFGVLLVTLLVRIVLVPAALFAPGERAWWPTRQGGCRPKRGDGS